MKFAEYINNHVDEYNHVPTNGHYVWHARIYGKYTAKEVAAQTPFYFDWDEWCENMPYNTKIEKRGKKIHFFFNTNRLNPGTEPNWLAYMVLERISD
jgi:hypothetical protein